MSESMFEVEGILDKKVKKDDVYYLINWRGFQRKDATWEPKSSLHTIQILIDAYESDQQKAKSVGKKAKSNKFNKKKSLKSDKDLDDVKSVYSQISRTSKYDESKRQDEQSAQQTQVNKKDSRVSLYQVKLNEKLREQEKAGRIRPYIAQQYKEKVSKESKESRESATRQKMKKQYTNEGQKEWQIQKIVYLAAKNKRLLEVKIGNSIFLKELDEVKKTCPAALCTFYQKMFKIIL